MTKLEEKLIELGYEKISHNYMTRLTRYKKDFDFIFLDSPAGLESGFLLSDHLTQHGRKSMPHKEELFKKND